MPILNDAFEFFFDNNLAKDTVGMISRAQLLAVNLIIREAKVIHMHLLGLSRFASSAFRVKVLSR